MAVRAEITEGCNSRLLCAAGRGGALCRSIVRGMIRRVVGAIASFGLFCRFVGETVGWLGSSLGRWNDLRLLTPQFYEVGVRSLPIVTVTGLFVGLILAVQTFVQFEAVGLASYLGSVINMSVVRELGPVLAGVMLAGRVGGALTAELGTMYVTEQIDALRTMGTDPVRYLVVPRFLACVLLTPFLTAYADLAGVFGGYFVSVWVFDVSGSLYWRYSAEAMELWDVWCGLSKSVLFGGAIAMVACYKGFHCRRGAAGVGRACTEAFVASFVAILTIDFFMGVLLKGLYEAIWGFKSVF